MGIVLAVLTFFWWTRIDTNSSSKSIDQERFTEIVLSGLPKILERWQEGDVENAFQSKDWKCDELPYVPIVTGGFLQCNPHYLECWARGLSGQKNHVVVESDGKSYELELRAVFPSIAKFAQGPRHTLWVTRNELENPIVPWAGVLIELGVKGLNGSWQMILEDTCRMKELPVRRYSYGPRPERHERTKEMDWDNDGRKIFIDKYLVSRSDINYWLLATNQADIAFENKKQNWALPSVELSVDEQTLYCAWLGKRRMEAHIWDAATMQPSNVDRPFPEFVVKSWLPWTRDRRGSFFEEAFLSAEWRPTKQNCNQAFVKECANVFPYTPYSSDNVSWMGIYHVLGGTPEVFRNPVESELTLKTSSYNLSASDPQHQLGRRIPAGEIPAGFRCYREEFE